MSKSVLNTAISTAFIVALGFSVSACSNEKESSESGKVLAVDRVDDAAELARKNAPAAEDIDFPETTAVATDTAADMEAAPDAAPAEGEETATAEPEVVAAGNAGEELYNAQCMACHATGLLNAPKYGDAAAWAPRIAQGKETLYDHSAHGFNQMPAQATNGVTEEQVHEAVDYMVAAAS